MDGKLTEPEEQTHQAVLNFFKRRLQHFLIGKAHPPDVVDAVLTYHLDPLVETVAKITTLQAFKERKEFEPLVGAVKRVVNILKDPVAEPVDPKRFADQAEKELYQEMTACVQNLEKPLAARDYNTVLEQLGHLKAPIDRFFDEVLVLDEDKAVRQNRLAMLTQIASLFQQLADFSRFVV